MNVVGKIWDECERFYYHQDDKDTLLLYGGAASGKSKTLARFFVYLLITQIDVKCFIFRKVGPVLKDSVISDIKGALTDFGITRYLENKTDRTITLWNGNTFNFRSMDDPEKIKSVDMNYFWMEEGSEFSLPEYSQLKLRARRQNENGKNFGAISYNPTGRSNWTYHTFFENEQPDTQICHSTFLDNPFLGEREVANIRKMEQLNPEYYVIYGLGQYGVLKGQIYKNFELIKPIHHGWDDIVYGLDFGFNNPMAIVKIGVYDQEFYILDEWYEREKTTGDLIAQFKKMKISSYDYIYADSAEPDRIEEIKRAGYNVYPAWKGKNSVKDGIDIIKQENLKIFNTCKNFSMEINSYKWREDKDGNVMDEPEKAHDHLMDAMRYAITSYIRNNHEIYAVNVGKSFNKTRFGR